MRLPVSALVLLVLSACSSPALLYTPTTPTVPIFERAGQVDATIALSSGEGATGSVAVSPITGVQLLASGARIDVQDADTPVYQRSYAEAGAGIYLPLADGLYFTAASGLGTGSQKGSGRIRSVEPGRPSDGGLCKPFCVPVVVGETWTYSSRVSTAFA